MESRRSLRIAAVSPKDEQILDLMRRIKDLIGQGMLSKVHTLLLERENNVQKELDKLRTDLALVESEKLKFKEKLESLKESQILKEKDDEISGLCKEICQLKEEICRSNQLVEDYLGKLSEAEYEKRISNEKVELIRSKMVDVDGLNMKLQNLESETKKFEDKVIDIQSMDDMRQQRVKDLQNVELRQLVVEDEKLKCREELESLPMSQILKEKNEEITDLYKELSQHKEQISRSDHLVKDHLAKLSEAENEKRISDEKLESMRCKLVDVDGLNTKLQELESEIKKLKDGKVLDLQSLEDMRKQKVKDMKIVQGLKKELLEALKTVDILKSESLKLNQTIKDMGIRLNDAEGMIKEERDSMIFWKLRCHNLEAKNFPQDGKNMVQAQNDFKRRMISPVPVSGSMLQSSADTIEISDSDDDERDHCQPAKAAGLSSTSWAEKDKNGKKVVSFSLPISPCSTSSLKRKQNSPGKEVGQSSKRQNQG